MGAGDRCWPAGRPPVSLTTFPSHRFSVFVKKKGEIHSSNRGGQYQIFEKTFIRLIFNQLITFQLIFVVRFIYNQLTIALLKIAHCWLVFSEIMRSIYKRFINRYVVEWVADERSWFSEQRQHVL